ncbi:MAG TPA: hypothetical protein VNX68_06005 [Nitrosopumilaceae archaeon]|jgi:hypothetical protein|nr:hypothetical protein [Nitrosopumilaceae archaeon]
MLHGWKDSEFIIRMVKKGHELHDKISNTVATRKVLFEKTEKEKPFTPARKPAKKQA